MKPHLVPFLLLAVLIQSPLLAAADSATTREFVDLHCKIVLPGPEFKWLDHSKVPDARAAFGDSSGMVVLLMAKHAPTRFVLDESEYDKGFCKPGIASKLEGRDITFRGVPCYQIHVRSEQNGSIATVRVFCANGYAFQLMLVGSKLPITERDKLDSIFSAFQFVGAPSIPVHAADAEKPPATASVAAPAVPSAPTPAASSAPVPAAPPEMERSLRFSQYMGRIAGLCFIAIVVLLVVKFLRRKKGQATKQS